MGFFTWTYADVPLKINKDGDYHKRCVLQYGDVGTLLCPDNTTYLETCYEGYGIFAGRDAYELAAEWNRPYILGMISAGIIDFTCWPKSFKEVMAAWAENDRDGLEKAVYKAAAEAPYLRDDWKRSIGIAICCENNERAHFPIKIVKTSRPKKYAEYPPSLVTQ